jgi:hypothetical protein
MSTYRHGLNGIVIRTDPDGSTWHIPTDPENADYRRCLADVAAGAVVADADPAPLVYSTLAGIDARTQTTDATQTELYRATLRQNTAYTAILTLSGVDLGNGAVRVIRASIVAKRLGNGAALVGAPVVIANHQDTGTSAWAIGASASGNDFVVTVTGAAGRTIAWRLAGSVESFTPGGA